MRKGSSIDLVKLAMYVLRRCWLLIICAAIGFGVMYWNTAYRQRDTYTASGTMYIVNASPNLVNYGYATSSDIYNAVQLINTYSVVVKSQKVMDKVLEFKLDEMDANGQPLMLCQKYPELRASSIAGSISMSSVNETGMVRVNCTTTDPQKSADICNAVLQVAPQAIVDVVGAGQAELVDAATVPRSPNGRNATRSGIRGAVYGAAAAAAVLAVLFLLNQRIETSRELTDNYKPPLLAEVLRDKRESDDPGRFLLSKRSPMDQVESYAKLRMNLFYTLVSKDNHAVMVTSAISGEGKSTITSNLAISSAMSGRKVLLIDADMRRACLRDVFHYNNEDYYGLSDVLVGSCPWRDALIRGKYDSLDILPAGHQPPNPTEMLESEAMRNLLKEVSAEYDLILLDSPPINIVSDPLALSSLVAGAMFVVRQGFSDHREVRKALLSAEMTGLNVLGFIFYGENLKQGSYYSRKYYRGYYHKYDTRDTTNDRDEGKRTAGGEN